MILDIPATAMSLAEVHAAIAAAPGVPPWYGRNLDALYDLLRSGTFEVRLDGAALRRAWPADFDRLWATLTDAATDNPKLTLVWRARG